MEIAININIVIDTNETWKVYLNILLRGKKQLHMRSHLLFETVCLTSLRRLPQSVHKFYYPKYLFSNIFEIEFSSEKIGH